ncbi:MAG: group II intron maturase-specific domain-containing protein [Streptomyces sp.]
MAASNICTALDHYVWWLTYRWARRMHPNTSKKWIVRRYVGRFNTFRSDRWVFGDRGHVLNDRGQLPILIKFSWTNIVRRQLIAGGVTRHPTIPG